MMKTDNHEQLAPEKPLETPPATFTATDATPGPVSPESPAEEHTAPSADTTRPSNGEYPIPNASERVDYGMIPPQNSNLNGTGNPQHHSNSKKSSKGPNPLIVAISSVITTVVAITLFYGSLTLADPILSGLVLLLSSILLLISVVLLLWGGILGGKAIFSNNGDKTAPGIAVAAAVIFAPIAAFFGAIGMIAAIASWFTGFF